MILKLFLLSIWLFSFKSYKAETVDIKEPSKYSYESDSVKQLKVRGDYGRYLIFTGRTENIFRGVAPTFIPGNPGITSCTSFGNNTTCSPLGFTSPMYIPGAPGGKQNKNFIYHLDCFDLTFDRKGDLLNAYGDKYGWMDVSRDPTAQTVASKFCPVINSLPKFLDYELHPLKKKKKNKVYKLSKRSEKFYLKGIDSSEKGNYEKAIEELTKAIKIEPKNEFAYFWRGDSKYRSYDPKNALVDFNKAIEINASKAYFYKGRASANIMLGKYEDGIKDLTKAIQTVNQKKYPEDLASSVYWRGYLYFKLNKFKESINDFSRVIEIDSNNPDGNYMLGLSKNFLFNEGCDLIQKGLDLGSKKFEEFPSEGLCY